MNNDEQQFDNTPDGIQAALTWLRSIGDIRTITDTNGSVNNENAVAYANVKYAFLNKPTTGSMSIYDIHGLPEPKEEENE